MVYKVIGLMSGSSLDGLDIVFVQLQERGGKWSYTLEAAACYEYEEEWKSRLMRAPGLSAREYLLLHADYGHYLGKKVNAFLEEMNLQLQAHLIASHGHTVFHLPEQGMTAQLGDGAAIAAETGLAVVSDLRALDVALHGQGAPIVPVGEQLLFPGYPLLLNIGGIANLSATNGNGHIAFDICPANAILNALAGRLGKSFDEGGQLARGGQVNPALLERLNALPYYRQPYPKSLDNSFGASTVLPLLQQSGLSVQGQLRTYTEHIAQQTDRAVRQLCAARAVPEGPLEMLVTGGGAFNGFLTEQIGHLLRAQQVEIVIPEDAVVKYKEALIMALLGLLRWREAPTTLRSVTGASRGSIGGALWMGQEG
ncbi:anhydro-N-acetylmuramic acid kinase [Compostibacter hankyongensis]|uniref:Anhydro-N-acetylmuramic acid kinase n=1 Tax=Compostibacter hankyongensis TaxID=1007089 RepID=A0ABP8GAU4_9BACT